MTEFKIELGSKVKSNINGFAGIVTARAEHLNGCDRYWVAPKVRKDGTMPEGCWFDEGELDVIGKTELSRKNSDRGGFPSTMK